MRKGLCLAVAAAALAAMPPAGHSQEVTGPTGAGMSGPGCTDQIVLPERVIAGRVLPAPSVIPVIVRAPLAWTRSTGDGVRVAIAGEGAASSVTAIAPDAYAENIEMDEAALVDGLPLAQALAQRRIDLLVIPVHTHYRAAELLAAVRDVVASGVAVLVSTDIQSGSQRWTQEIQLSNLRAAGAITVASLDVNGAACYLLFPIDVLAPSLESPTPWYRSGGGALTAAGIAALLLGASPGLCPDTLRQRLVSTADPMYEGTDPESCLWTPSLVFVDPVTGDYRPTSGSFTFGRVNAARALGVALEVRWPLNAIGAPDALLAATGSGVIVAVIDQGFHVRNPAFAGHLIATKAFYPGTFDPPQNFHGTSMAKTVLAVAPDASLVFLNHGERSDMEATEAHAFAQCVDYAVAFGAHVITSSDGPWPNTPEVWDAIDRAVASGVTVVWIHYEGPNQAVIRPTYLWLPGDVGAFDRFFEDDKPSDLEGGLSITSPQIAGIAALVLQQEPDLSPLEVKQRIMATATPLAGCAGCTIADAAAAVANRTPGVHRVRRHLR